MTEMERIERQVWGNVCRCCNRPIESPLTVADKDAEGWPRCTECAGAEQGRKVRDTFKAKLGQVAVELPEFGCFAWLDEGTLLCAEIGEFNEHGFDDEYAVEVTAPESQAFLDAVNEVFGTEFRFDQFAGR